MRFKNALSCLLLAALGSVSFAAGAAPTYTITPVGSLGNGAGAPAAGGLNNSGQVVGFSYDGNNVPSAYVSSGGQIANLHPSGASASFANAINEAGTIVGDVAEQGGGTRAAIFGAGGVTLLGTLGGGNSYANGINSGGQIVGSSYLSADSALHAFITQGNGLTDLGTLVGAGGYSEANAINDGGVVVGYSASADGGYHAFSFTDGKMTDLGTLGGLYSEATAVNSSGTITGYAYLAGDIVAHAFIYANGILADLGTLGSASSYAYDLNDAGDVVGGLEYVSANGTAIERRAFLYSDGQLVDLNSLIDPLSGWVLQTANAINDNGQISARACVGATLNCQDVLLTLADTGGGDTPSTDVPEPEAFTAGIAGLALFGWLRRRRRQR